MLEKFLSYIQSECLTDKNQKILVAVSGGIDSMCLLNLLHQAGFELTIAHCNFKLRGEESDGDEQFVRSVAEQLKIQVYVKQFETLEFAKLQKVSVQMAARDLRYAWFENLRRTISYDKIAIAHHADDSIETFFINIIRGTGIQGISGIRPSINHIIRPLLFAFRDELEAYGIANNIAYRTDSSNQSGKYLRNKLRNTVLPLFSEINQEFKTTMLQNLIKFGQAETIYNTYIESAKKHLIEISNENEVKISIEGIFSTSSPNAVLYEIIKDFGFSSKISEDIFNSLHAGSGKKFYSKEYRILKDRDDLILNRIHDPKDEKYFVLEDIREMEFPISLKIKLIENVNYEIIKNPYIAAFDYEKLTFPLVLRKWQTGDYFQPLGMKGIKKISDFFIDNKISIAQKENTWILVSANEIVWIVGMRIDDKYKITECTKMIYEIEI
jgi:tRNA(Ile)-lysidine synthase